MRRALPTAAVSASRLPGTLQLGLLAGALLAALFLGSGSDAAAPVAATAPCTHLSWERASAPASELRKVLHLPGAASGVQRCAGSGWLRAPVGPPGGAPGFVPGRAQALAQLRARQAAATVARWCALDAPPRGAPGGVPRHVLGSSQPPSRS